MKLLKSKLALAHGRVSSTVRRRATWAIVYTGGLMMDAIRRVK